jgi:hypothetical protein
MKTRTLLAVAVLLTSGFGQAAAQSSNDTRVANLEETVRLLERRVAALEDQLRAGATPTRVNSANADWRKLQIGMAESAVQELLGSPSKVDANEITITWYYGYPIGGSVHFDAASRTVKRWTEP